MAEPRNWADGLAGTVIGADIWNGRTVLATDWSGGRLIAVTVEQGELTPWGDGYSEPESVSVAGDDALITERTGALLRQDLNQPGRANAQVVASGIGALHQVVRSDDGAAALVADHSGGRIVRVDLATGDVSDVLTGLGQPTGLAVGVDGTIFVTQQLTGSLTRHDPNGTTTVVAGLVSPFLLSWADSERTRLLVTERAPAHRVGIVDVTAAAPVLERLVGRGITQPSQAIVIGDLLVVTGAGRLLALDASGGLTPGVRVTPLDGPLWPGSWADIEIDTGVTGWTRADLSLSTEPAGAITIDEHPNADPDPSRPRVRLLAHGTLGPVDVIVTDTATMTEVGRGGVEVGFDSSSPLDGPPVWVDTPGQPPLLHTLAATRGVDDAGARKPKDSAGKPTPAWRVLAALVDTTDARWSVTVTPTAPAPTIATAQTALRNTLIGANGVDAFYREMSANRLSVQLVTGAVQGPVKLDGTWTDWFTMPTGTTQWLVKDDVVQRVVTALQAVTDWTKVDALFLMFRSPTSANFIWPRASIGRTYLVQAKDGQGKDVKVTIAKIGMPHNQTSIPGLGFTTVEVTAHELGHTLGLDDIYMDTSYSADMQKRTLGTKELMANEQTLPHLSARHKLLLGFLDPGHVRSFSYGFADEATFDLVAGSDGIPSGGRFAAVELKVAPRLSWFFEYRAPRPGRIGDQGGSFTGGKVMGYDATKYELPPISADKRRPIILLLDDGDGEGAVLAAGNDYEHLDVEGQALSQFRLEVLSMTATTARVKVKVGAVSAPDPYLETNRGEDGDYKSPDIEIRNELSDANPAWLNRPIIVSDPNIKPNRVVAKVHNGGGLDAPNVTVRFKVLPFNTDDKDSERWVDLGDPVKHEVKAGKTVEFETQWSPDHDAHFCVQARIDRYTQPGVPFEPDVDNNLAQSNYFKIESKPSSPATREVSFVEVHNPFTYAASALVEVAQDSDAYRTFVDHQWLHLEPGQTRLVRMEVESRATSIWDAIEREYPDGNSWLRTWLPADGCVSRSGSGVTLAATTAVRTSVRVVERSPGQLLVQVTSPAGGPPPHDGTVLLQVDGEDGRHEVVSAPVEANGLADVRFEPVTGRGTLHYSGTRGYATLSGVEVDLEQ